LASGRQLPPSCGHWRRRLARLMGILHLRFKSEDEWHGLLTAKVSSDGFVGQASAWFSTEDLRRFSQAMTAYPLLMDALPSISGGFGAEPGKPEPEQVHLAIDVAPHDVRGMLRFTVRLATEVLTTQDDDLGCHATVRFLATYDDLGLFALQVSDLAKGHTDEAVLHTNVG
jgi:hypothetical protein